MKVSSIVQSSFSKVAGVCVLGLGLSLGGCNKQLKEDHAALMTQNSALIAENNQLKTNQDAMAARITAMEQTPKPMAGYDNAPMAPMDGRTVNNYPRSSRGETIVIAGDVLFDPGQATIKAGAKKELDQVASKLRSKHSGQDVRVEGYTDSDPLVKTKAKWGSNEGLSEARAEAVRKYLVGKGISGSQISAVGMGSAKPKASKKDSRRVEIVVVE